MNSAIVESTVVAAEGGEQLAVVGTAEIAVCQRRVSTVLARVSEAATNRCVEGGRERRLMVNLPNMVQRNLRLVVLVVVARFLVAVVVVSVCRIEAAIVHSVLHVFLHFLPLRQRECTVASRALVVPLRGAEACQRELVMVVDTLGDIREIGVAFKVCALYVAVAPCARAQYRDGPSVLHQARGDRERYLVVAVIAHGVTEESAFLRVNTFGNDVDSTAYGRRTHLAGTHTALGLHHAGYIA